MRYGVIVLLLALAGCAGESETSKPASQPEPSLPACSEVWVDGATLPEGYEGCMDGGDIVAPAGYDCDSGGGQMLGHEDRFWVLTRDGVIHKGGAESGAYQADYEACFAD